jgi:hypothetical protein
MFLCTFAMIKKLNIMCRERGVPGKQQMSFTPQAEQYAMQVASEPENDQELEAKRKAFAEHDARDPLWWLTDEGHAEYLACMTPEERREYDEQSAIRHAAQEELTRLCYPITGEWYRQWKTETYGYDYDYYKTVYGN